MTPNTTQPRPIHTVGDSVSPRKITPSATPIGTAQLARLQKGLATSFGRDLAINLVVDPSIIGGLRVQVGDDVIDGTVARKLAELRLQMAG